MFPALVLHNRELLAMMKKKCLTHCEIGVSPVDHDTPLVIVLHLTQSAPFDVFTDNSSSFYSHPLLLIHLLLFFADFLGG